MERKRKGAIRRVHEWWRRFQGNRFRSWGFYWCAMGMSFSPVPIAGSGASTVRTPSLLNEDLMLSGFVPFGNKNSRLYSLYTDLLSVFSSCFAWTNSLLSTVLTTISSGVYWETSNRSFNILLSPSSWIRGLFKPSNQAESCWGLRELLFWVLCVVVLLKLSNADRFGGAAGSTLSQPSVFEVVDVRCSLVLVWCRLRVSHQRANAESQSEGETEVEQEGNRGSLLLLLTLLWLVSFGRIFISNLLTTLDFLFLFLDNFTVSWRQH